MAKLLYVSANPKSVETSASLTIASEFITKYSEINPNDTIEVLDLFNAELVDIDYDVMEAFGNLQTGKELSPVQEEKLRKRKVILDQFLSADKLVFAIPMWELSYPAVLKVYIDTIVAAGVTFKYTEQGMPIGLTENKKALLVHASGGIYPNVFESPFGLGNVKGILEFIGVNSVESILLQGTSFALEQALTTGRENIEGIVKNF